MQSEIGTTRRPNGRRTRKSLPVSAASRTWTALKPPTPSLYDTPPSANVNASSWLARSHADRVPVPSNYAVIW